MVQRLYPVGIQTFSEIREKGLLYIDKTEHVYRMTHMSKYVFLNRPRRFGKSLLVSTLKSYFEGRKDLFEGLAIDKLETEWNSYPVLHFSMAGGKHMEKDALERYLLYILQANETHFGVTCDSRDPNIRLYNLITTVYQQTGKQVVVLIDEYDAPLLDVVHEDEHLEELRQVMRNFYSPLKDADPYLRFVFLTGITKFSQVSIFSELNNINNVSLLPEFSDICGITFEELETELHDDVEQLGKRLHMDYGQTLQALRAHYDGYHFAWPSPDIFNPFSLLSAFLNGNLNDYWFSTGTPTFLLKMMQRFHTLPSDIGETTVKESAFDAPTENMGSLTPLLYQSGYITIKGFDPEMRLYTLDLPNREIRTGLFESLLPLYLGHLHEKGDTTIAYMAKHIREGNMERALQLLQTFLSSVPYCNDTNHEGHYQQMLFVIFSLLTPYLADVEVHTAHGRIDIALTTPTRIYIMELKLNQSAVAALQQTVRKNYAERFALSRLPVTAVGINFSSQTGNLTDWAIQDIE